MLSPAKGTGKTAAKSPAAAAAKPGGPASAKSASSPKSTGSPSARPSGKPAAKAPGAPPAVPGRSSPVAKAPEAPTAPKTGGLAATSTPPRSGAAKGPSKSAKGALPASPAAPPGPAAPRKWPKGGPSKADLKRYREALIARRSELLSSSKELAAEVLQSAGGDFSVDHMADHGSDNYEQDFNLKLLEGEAGQLGEIRDALAKIDGKADLPFGLCEGCADDPQGRCESCPWIPTSRLDAIPQARLCVQMKAREESAK